MAASIEIVSATRRSKKAFWGESALGLSLQRLAHDKRLVAQIAYANKRGLPGIYNARIASADQRDFLVFVHDDVWIDDASLADRVIEGCGAFDVIGIVGNRRRVQRQPSWASVGVPLEWDDKANLSGSIAHGAAPSGTVSVYGEAPAECELLDGVFLAAKKSILREGAVSFDPRFDFHFYDLDFCRLARQKGLRLGTWPVSITHQSSGGMGTPAWVEKYQAYLDKWGG
jgi:GT2 family glycosyltransferase